jgi:hypothetical protein
LGEANKGQRDEWTDLGRLQGFESIVTDEVITLPILRVGEAMALNQRRVGTRKGKEYGMRKELWKSKEPRKGES